MTAADAATGLAAGDVGFVGLGAMGAPMAANLGPGTRVWNRTAAVATEHAATHGTVAVDHVVDLAGCAVVATCLPTTAEVVAVAAELAPHLAAGTVWIDHTSGDPAASRELATDLERRGVRYLDAPVSGGTDGAAARTLTVMVGGDPDVLGEVRGVLDRVGQRIVHLGPAGSGHAVKAVSNALLAAALWSTAEGLTALVAQGVDASAALEVINGSAGRSNATERLFPERVVTRAFPPTFALGLLAKDVRLAGQVLEAGGVDGEVLALVRRLTDAASDELGAEVDHTALVRVIEAVRGVEIR